MRALCLCLLVACGDDGSIAGTDGGTGDAPGGVGEPPELVGMTLFHNEVRAAVGVPPLQWDPDLAAHAKAYVMQCIDNQPPAGLVDHNEDRQGIAGYPYIGENIYASSGMGTARDAVDSWASEKPRYDPATGNCSGTCGHYTQIVWRTTTHVGCAIHDCNGLQYSGTVLCNYGPGGNSGGKAY